MRRCISSGVISTVGTPASANISLRSACNICRALAFTLRVIAGSGAPDRAFGVSSLQQIPLHLLQIDANARVLVAVKVQGAIAPAKDNDKVWPYTICDMLRGLANSFGIRGDYFEGPCFRDPLNHMAARMLRVFRK